MLSQSQSRAAAAAAAGTGGGALPLAPEAGVLHAVSVGSVLAGQIPNSKWHLPAMQTLAHSLLASIGDGGVTESCTDFPATPTLLHNIVLVLSLHKYRCCMCVSFTAAKRGADWHGARVRLHAQEGWKVPPTHLRGVLPWRRLHTHKPRRPQQRCISIT
jgi:hypothetical protein